MRISKQKEKELNELFAESFTIYRYGKTKRIREVGTQQCRIIQKVLEIIGVEFQNES